MSSSQPEAPGPGASSFPPGPAFTWDPVPWNGRARMAADADAFEAAEQEGGPGRARLTFWSWAEPTVSLGRLHDPATMLDGDAVREAALPVVIRPTGGRALLHVNEWTYSALIPGDHPRLGGNLHESMRLVVALIADALEEAYGLHLDPLDVPRDRSFSSSPLRGPVDACFSSSFGHEITWQSRKLMGSAQQRGRRVLLQQGSLLVGGGHERLVRVLAGSARERDAQERALASGSITLGEILGSAPDPEPFRLSLARRWPAERDSPAQG